MITVIFEFIPHEGRFPDYMRVVDTLREDLAKAEGFISLGDRLVSAPGSLTHIRFAAELARSQVTQIAFAEDVIAAVYAQGVYASRGRNPMSNASDMVFADSLASELATITGGDASSGFTAEFTVGVAL